MAAPEISRLVGKGSIVAALFIVAALILLWRSPYSASHFEIAPDSTEYAVGGAEIAQHGRYRITIEGRPYPPRYAPFFATAFMAPIFFFTDDLGMAILPVILSGLFAVFFAQRIGHRLGGDAGGAAAAFGLIALPLFRIWGRLVMTDIPSLAIFLGTMLLFLDLAERRERPAVRWLIAGILVAANYLIRPVSGAAAIPFAVLALFETSWPRKIVRGALLGLPIILAQAAQMAYNRAVFGSAGRSGYHLWSGVPYDYPSLSFSASYVRQNLDYLGDTRLFIYLGLAVILHLIARRFPNRDRRPWTAELSAWGFFVATALPLVSLHLLYYSHRPRYYLPVLGMALILLGAGFGRLIGDRLKAATIGITLFFSFGVAVYAQTRIADPLPTRRMTVDEIVRLTPPDAIVITRVPAPFVEWMTNRSGSRTILVHARRDQYAQTVLTPRKILNPDPPPLGPKDYRCRGLLNGGAEEAVPRVALQRLDEIDAWVKAAGPFFSRPATACSMTRMS